MEFRNSGIVHGLIEPIPYSSVEPGSAFAAHDYPVDAREVDFPEIFEKRLNRQKAQFRARLLQICDSWQSVLAILNTDSPPDVFPVRSKAQLSIYEAAQPLRSLCEQLICVPIGN